MKIPNRRVVQAEIVSDEANSPPQDTEPHGGAHELPDQVSEHQWVMGDPFYDDDKDPFAYDPAEDLDRPDDDERDENVSDYNAEDERDRKVQAFLVESGYDAQFVPPWSPVPTALGKAFITQNRDAQIDIVFPTVYEEDRTAKIKDLATAQALDTITHQRMSDQIAKEMGFENYDYSEESDQIKDEKKKTQTGSSAIGSTGELGIADDLASQTIGLNVGPGGEITPKKGGAGGIGPGGGSTGPQPIGAPAPAMAADDAGKKRGEISDRSVSQWKKYQGRNYEAQQPSVKRIVRDKRGLITKIIEE
jgi:hypothetical protein